MSYLLINILPCLLLGLVIGVLLTGLFLLLVKLLNSRLEFTPLKGILVLALSIFYIVQSVMMVGAHYTIDYVEDKEQSLNSLTRTFSRNMNVEGQEDVLAMKHTMEENYPELTPFVEKLDINTQSYTGGDVSSQISVILKSEINQFFWRRIMWITGVSVLFLVIFLGGSSSNTKGRRARYSDGQRCRTENRRVRISRRR